MRVQTVIILLPLLFVISCKSVDTVRIKKDIVGINEQLYELEKDQIVIEEKIKRLTSRKEISKVENKNDKTFNKKSIYTKGYKLFLEENYSKAVSILGELVRAYSTDTITDNALFWIAESYMKLNDLKKAVRYYKILYRYFPFSEKADYALYKIGYIYYKLKDYIKSDLAFIKILREYPTSDFKRSALNFRKKIKKNRRKR